MRSRREQGEHGAALVEAAIIMPLVLLITFGIIEFGFAFNEQGTARSATRSAARAISTVPKADAGSGPGKFESVALGALETAVKNLNSGQPDFVLIYDASTGASPSDLSGCGTDCMYYDWDDATDTFVGGTGDPWDRHERDACVGQSNEVGIFLVVDHDYITGVPGIVSATDTVALKSRTVMRLEPHTGADCDDEIPGPNP